MVSSETMFIPSFMKIHPLVEILLRGHTHRHDNATFVSRELAKCKLDLVGVY
jgi:hypothetical protein